MLEHTILSCQTDNWQLWCTWHYFWQVHTLIITELFSIQNSSFLATLLHVLPYSTAHSCQFENLQLCAQAWHVKLKQTNFLNSTFKKTCDFKIKYLHLCYSILTHNFFKLYRKNWFLDCWEFNFRQIISVIL